MLNNILKTIRFNSHVVVAVIFVQLLHLLAQLRQIARSSRDRIDDRSRAGYAILFNKC